MARLVCVAAVFAIGASAGTALSAEPRHVVAIILPVQEQTIYSNEGELVIEARFTPPPTAPNAHWVVHIDGREFASAPVDGPIQVRGIERGEHVLTIELRDAAGVKLAVSGPVTFRMWQASRLLPADKKKPRN